MPNLEDDLLDQEITIDREIDPNEVEELETISNQLYHALCKDPFDFNAWETEFIENLFYLDKEEISPKQREWLYNLDEKFLRG